MKRLNQKIRKSSARDLKTRILIGKVTDRMQFLARDKAIAAEDAKMLESMDLETFIRTVIENARKELKVHQ
jgi:hypothetical protein